MPESQDPTPESENPKKVANYNMEGSQNAGGVVNADTVNAGRIGGDIWNLFFGQQLAPVGNPTRPKNEWLVAELKSRYTVPTKLGEVWAENHQLLPLLDGLDSP